jgi:hypothetical protein
MHTSSKLSLLDKFTRDEPRPRYRHPSYDPTQPRIDRRAIIEDTRAFLKDAEVIATLARQIESTPEAVTLSQLRMRALENNPALQPAAHFESSAATAVKLLDGIRAASPSLDRFGPSIIYTNTAALLKDRQSAADANHRYNPAVHK